MVRQARVACRRCDLLKRVIVIFGLSFAGSAYAVDEDAADPNKAIVEMIQVAPADPQSNDCVVKITADFAKFYERLPIFRNAFLNHDFSIDFYKQRRKQVFSFTILRRVAELITEGLYRGQSTPICRFSITVDYLDKFGQDRMFEALTWRFNNEQAAKINWEKFDPRDFNEVALEYDLKPQLMDWYSDEPQMSGATPAAPSESCDIFLFNANAIFIRATTFCKKDYMDSEEGLAALEGAKRCPMSDSDMKVKARSATLSLDNIAKRQGRAAVCQFVETIAHEVRREMR
jgi:hypothetical protein